MHEIVFMQTQNVLKAIKALSINEKKTKTKTKTKKQKHQFFGSQLSSQSNFHIHTWPLEKP